MDTTMAKSRSPVLHQPGGVGRRAAARLVDLILVYLLELVLGLFVGLDARLIFGANAWAKLDAIPNPAWISVGAALYFVYFVAFEAVGGRTLGKRLFGLRVHGPAGAAKPDLKQSVIRNAFLLLALLPAILTLPDWVTGLGAALFGIAALVIAISLQRSPTRQGIHDRMAGGTLVVKTASADATPRR